MRHIALVLILFALSAPATCVAVEVGGPAVFRIACYDGYAPDELTTPFIALVRERLGRDIIIERSQLNENKDVYDRLRGRAADVVSITNNCFKAEKYRLIANGLLRPIAVAGLPHWHDVLPALRAADYASDGGQIYAVPMNFGCYGLLYDSAKVVPAPTSWKAVLDPAADVAVSAEWEQALIASVALAQGVPRADAQVLEKVDTPPLRAALRQLGRTTRVWQGVDDAKTIRGGRLAFGWGFALADLNQAGEPWRMAEPEEGMIGYVDNWTIAAGVAPGMLDVATLWCDFTLWPTSQAHLVRSLSVHPVTSTVTAALTPAEAAAARVDDPAFLAKLVMLTAQDVRSENGFKRLWHDAREARGPRP